MSGVHHVRAWSIRPTHPDDCALLPSIERSAAKTFLSDPELAWLAHAEPIAAVRHREFMDRGICLVAAGERNRPFGFVVSERFGTELHIWELSVARDRQGTGIGRALLGALDEAAGAASYRALTLTTFSDLPWNGPFYRSCGFAEIDASKVGERLAAMLNDDRQHGLPPNRRCAMIKRL